ncbi:hypothetical protein OHA28_11175 [Streptomyces sp. NBC_00269]|uniref:hypothetical protein n=1 Tax=Streptomyces sp. NBC_00269 TaxID=2975696 RepID=UPI002E29291D|nr:hypothetical protein [Streptomyces sp. NBC_00269]
MADVTRRVRCWIVYAAIGGVVVVLDVAGAPDGYRRLPCSVADGQGGDRPNKPEA